MGSLDPHLLQTAPTPALLPTMCILPPPVFFVGASQSTGFSLVHDLRSDPVPPSDLLCQRCFPQVTVQCLAQQKNAIHAGDQLPMTSATRKQSATFWHVSPLGSSSALYLHFSLWSATVRRLMACTLQFLLACDCSLARRCQLATALSILHSLFLLFPSSKHRSSFHQCSAYIFSTVWFLLFLFRDTAPFFVSSTHVSINSLLLLLFFFQRAPIPL